jgi:hypothetical protein
MRKYSAHIYDLHKVSWVHLTAHPQSRRVERQNGYGLCNGKDE